MFKKYRRNEDILVIKWDGSSKVYEAICQQMREIAPVHMIGMSGTTIGVDYKISSDKVTLSIPLNKYVVFDMFEALPVKAYDLAQLNRFYTPLDIQFENDGLEYRGYGIIPYNIKPIQAGIQYSHAIVEYVLDNFNTKAFRLWGKLHKTAVLLDGGTSNHSENRYSEEEYIGSMEQHCEFLKENGVTFSTFYEPDLNDMLSCIFVIADERTFNFKKYPDYGMRYDASKKILVKEPFWAPNLQPTQEWIDNLGGEKIYQLREYLRKMPLWRP